MEEKSRPSTSEPKIESFMIIRKDRRVFHLRAVEVVLAMSIFIVSLASQLPLSNVANFLISSGVAGSIIPVLVMFSDTAMSTYKLDPMISLGLTVTCMLWYLLAISSTSVELPSIELNKYKFYHATIAGMIMMVIMVILLFVDTTISFIKLSSSPNDGFNTTTVNK